MSNLSLPRITPGAIRLRYREKFGHGVAVAYYRDAIRPRILRTPPVEETADKSCEIHVLTSRADWLNLIWTLKSFYANSPKKYALCIHADATLPVEAAETLRRHFPAARIISWPVAEAAIVANLKSFPRCLAFRRANLLAPKVFDFAAFLQSDRMAIFDSDLLFFAQPKEYLKRIDDRDFRKNAFNADCGEGAYTVTPETVSRCTGMALHPLINSGLGLVHRESMRFEWFEEFLALPGILDGHFWRIEQTLFALCSSRFGVELLPDDYTVFLNPGIGRRPFRHYVGPVRHLMYREGMRQLVRQGILESTSKSAWGRVANGL